MPSTSSSSKPVLDTLRQPWRDLWDRPPARLAQEPEAWRPFGA